MNLLIIFAWSIVNKYTTLYELRSAWVYHNPFVISMAVMLFLLFSKISLKNKIVNKLSGASFTYFLFHGYLLNRIGIEKYVVQPFYIMLLHIVITVLMIYIIS